MWIDTFCVPFGDPDRAACLRSLGTIYGNAAKVVVVLTGAAARVIDETARSGLVPYSNGVLFIKIPRDCKNESHPQRWGHTLRYRSYDS
jgi:hypothetical protein